MSPSKSVALLSLAIGALTAHADQRHAGKEVGQGETEWNSTEPKMGNAFPMADGEVEDVDKESKSITLKHGPLKTKTIEMGPMTMPFAVKDARLLSHIKVGDKVKFSAEYANDVFTITSLHVEN